MGYPEAAHLMDEKWNRIPLHWAIRCNPPNIPVIKVLLKNNCNGAAVRDENRQTALNYHLWFSLSPNIKLVELLTGSHPDVVRLTDRYEWTALHHAAKSENWEICRFLIDKYPEALLKK